MTDCNQKECKCTQVGRIEFNNTFPGIIKVFQGEYIIACPNCKCTDLREGDNKDILLCSGCDTIMGHRHRPQEMDYANY